MQKISKADLQLMEELRAKVLSPTLNAEIVDTAADAIQILQIGERALGDGFQFVEDIVQLIQVQPLVIEIGKDAIKALQEIKILNPDLADDVAIEIYEEVLRRGSLGPISKWAVNTFYAVGSTYQVLDEVVGKLTGQLDVLKRFVAGDMIIPTRA